jgi:hypothetical protein
MSDDKDENLSPYAPIHVSVLLHLARDIVANVKENNWTEDDAERAMKNLWYMAAKNGPLENPKQAYDRAIAAAAGKDVSTTKH